MAFTVPDPIIKPYCNSGDKVDPPINVSTTVANQETGFPASQSTPLSSGGVPVNRTQFNGVLNFYTNQILAIQAGNPYTFNQDFSDEFGGYPEGIVLYCASNNSYQKSLLTNNTANFITIPSYINDGINWTAVTIDEIYAYGLRLYTNDRSFYVGLLSATTPTETYHIRFPENQATENGQYMTFDTSGNSYWVGDTYSEKTGGTPYSLPNNAWTNILTLSSLPNGTYDISGLLVAQDAIQDLFINIGTVLGSGGAFPSGYIFGYDTALYTPGGGGAGSVSIPRLRITITSGPKNVYLNAYQISSGSLNANVFGSIIATKVYKD